MYMINKHLVLEQGGDTPPILCQWHQPHTGFTLLASFPPTPALFTNYPSTSLHQVKTRPYWISQFYVRNVNGSLTQVTTVHCVALLCLITDSENCLLAEVYELCCLGPWGNDQNTNSTQHPRPGFYLINHQQKSYFLNLLTAFGLPPNEKSFQMTPKHKHVVYSTTRSKCNPETAN